MLVFGATLKGVEEVRKAERPAPFLMRFTEEIPGQVQVGPSGFSDDPTYLGNTTNGGYARTMSPTSPGSRQDPQKRQPR